MIGKGKPQEAHPAFRAALVVVGEGRRRDRQSVAPNSLGRSDYIGRHGGIALF
jgi:hypothetical protein